PPEHGPGFAEIALEKGRVAQVGSGRAAIADDSGIGAVALDGRPGIHSARYGGPDATDEENLDKPLREGAAAGGSRRAFYTPALAPVQGDGTDPGLDTPCEGSLIEDPRGEGGFGYDPAFVPDATGPDDERTMSELSQAEKNEISHRGIAARLLAEHLGASRPQP